MNALIVNADDFGINAGTNAAVRELAAVGAISSTSIMVNMPLVGEIRDIVAANPALGVGLHVNLSQGGPLLDPETVPTLVDGSGRFHRPPVLARRALTGRVALDEVRREVTAQIQRARELVGDRLDHWDSHQGTHRFEPLAGAVIAACAAQGVGAMRTHRHRFVTPDAGPGARRPPLTRALKESYYAWLTHRASAHFVLPEALLVIAGRRTSAVLEHVASGGTPSGCVEIPCHPAATLAGLQNTSMLQSRIDEFEFLRSPVWLQAVRSGHVRLVNFAWLVEQRGTRRSRHEQLAATAV